MFVGYLNQTSTKNVKQMQGVPFQNVSGADIDIQEISCLNGTKDPSNGAFHIWWFDTTKLTYVKGKYTKKAYADDGQDDGDGTEYTDKFYWTTDNTDAYILVPAGWKHDADAPATIVEHGKTFIAGESFFMQSSSTTPVVQFKNPFYVAPAE